MDMDMDEPEWKKSERRKKRVLRKSNGQSQGSFASLIAIGGFVLFMLVVFVFAHTRSSKKNAVRNQPRMNGAKNSLDQKDQGEPLQLHQSNSFRFGHHSKVCNDHHIPAREIRLKIEGGQASGAKILTNLVKSMCQVAFQKYGHKHVEHIPLKDHDSSAWSVCQFTKLGGIKSKPPLVTITAPNDFSIGRPEILEKISSKTLTLTDFSEPPCVHADMWSSCWCEIDERFLVIIRDPRDVAVAASTVPLQIMKDDSNTSNEEDDYVMNIMNWVAVRYQYWKNGLFSRTMVEFNEVCSANPPALRSIAQVALLEFLSDDDLQKAAHQSSLGADCSQLSISTTKKWEAQLRTTFTWFPELLEIWGTTKNTQAT